jgi:LPXTG-site transpeptidase (sortase) family protein
VTDGPPPAPAVGIAATTAPAVGIARVPAIGVAAVAGALQPEPPPPAPTPASPWPQRAERARISRQIEVTVFAIIGLLLLTLAGLVAVGGAGERWSLPAAGWVEPCVHGACLEVGTAAAPGGPTRVQIPSIKVDSSLEPLHRGADGVLQAPEAYLRAGWYAEGVVPGDPGPAVIAGHVDSLDGPAVFARLHELRVGDQVVVVRGSESVVFQVTATGRYPKNRFPTDEVYGPTPGAELRLITCGGAFDDSRRSYRDNVVVYAVAVTG